MGEQLVIYRTRQDNTRQDLTRHPKMLEFRPSGKYEKAMVTHGG